MRNLNLELAAIKRELGALHRLTRDVRRRAQKLDERFRALPPEIKTALDALHNDAVVARSGAETIGNNVEVLRNYVHAASDVLKAARG